MRLLSDAQYEAALDRERKMVISNLFREIYSLHKNLPRSAVTKKNVLCCVLLLIDPTNCQVELVRPKTRVAPEVEAPRETAINHAALKDRVGGA